jgi:hypothetical protein
VPPALRTLPVHVELTEAAIGQHLPVGPERLVEDLLAVGDEEQ